MAFRLARLTFQPLWADEGYSVYFASLDAVTLARATAADIHPPFYYYLLKLWMAVWGAGEFSLRLLSVFLGVAAVAFTYALASRLVGRRVGALAALLLALSPFHIYYSQEVRMYALVVLLTTASTLFMVRALEDWQAPPDGAATGSWRRVRRGSAYALLYVAATALALYTLYYAAFIPLAQTLFVLAVYGRRWRMIVRWCATQGAVVLLYAPWIAVASGALATYVAGKVAVEAYAALDPLRFLAGVLSALGMGVPSGGRWWLAAAALPVIGLAAVGALWRERRGQESPHNGEAPPALNPAAQAGRRLVPESRAILLPVLVVGAPLVLGYLVNLLWPFGPAGFQRLFLFCLPSLLILAARGLVLLWCEAIRLPARRQAVNQRDRLLVSGLALVAALTAGLTGAVLLDFYLSPRYARDDYRPLVRSMSAYGHPDDVVVALYPWQIGFVQSYYAGALPTLVFVENAADWDRSPAKMQSDLDALGNAHGRLWFMSYEAAGRVMESAVAGYLDRSAFPALNRWFADHRLLLYSFGETALVRDTALQAGDGLTLESASVSLDPVEAGKECVLVDLRWRSPGGFGAHKQVALRLADDSGRSWARRDSGPGNGQHALYSPADLAVDDHHAVLIPSTTPPGSYRLLLSVFDPDAGRSVPLSAGDGRALGGEIELAKVVVTRSSYHPPVAALQIPQGARVSFVGGPQLVGYSAPKTLRPGHVVQLDLYWQAQDKMEDDLVLFVQVRDQRNKVWGLYEGLPVAPQYPVSLWTAGEILRGQISFLLAPDTPAGRYRIAIGWLKGRSKERLPVVGGGEETLAALVDVVGRAHVMTLPQPGTPRDERVGEDIQFLGYDGDLRNLKPGVPLRLVLYWRALARMDTAYTVFVHLVDETGRILTQQDSEPVAGDIPTTAWLPGEVVSDVYTLQPPPSLPAGSYRVLVGMYGGASRSRLAVRSSASGGSSDAIELGRVDVAAP